MARPYNKLRSLMQEYECDQEKLARALQKSPRYISTRINGYASWELDECYKVLRLFNLPPDMLPKVFPEGGRNEKAILPQHGVSLAR